MFKKLKQKRLQKKYKKARPIYIIVFWAKWAVLPAKFSGKIDKNNDPLIIHFTDHNGAEDWYYITPWQYASSGYTIAYSFNKQEAQILAKWLNDKQIYG